MMGFTAAGPAAGSRLRAAEIFGARQFGATVVDDVVTGKSGGYEGPQLRDLHLHKDRGQDEKRLHYIGGDHNAQGDQSEWSFAGEAPFGPHERGANRGEELVPGRRPVDQQFRRVVTFDDGLFEFEGFNHACDTLVFLSRVI
jgi:hypothetical protein